MLLGKGDAAIADRLVEALDCCEAAVGERFVDERPQMLGRLQFGAVGGLEDKADAISARMSPNISLQTALLTYIIVSSGFM